MQNDHPVSLLTGVLGRLPFVAVCLALVLSAGAQQSSRFETTESEDLRWFKGNTHTHTLESDGDASPDAVIEWYKKHGYSFLVISDHNVFVDPARFANLTDSSFLLIPGEELSTSFEKKPVHVNGLNIPGVIEQRTDSTLNGTLQKNIDAVRQAGGLPHINHPNFRWALSAEVIAQVKNARLIEIFNGHPEVHNQGGFDSPGAEEIWDRLLTGGKRVYGIAVDDAHHFLGEFSPDRANPGRGWVVVRAKSLTPPDIIAGLEAGRFYSSTGVELDTLITTAARMEIRIRPKGDFKYVTEFVGDGGKVLLRTGGNPAVYELSGSPRYIRARVKDSAGHFAWTQPAFVIN